MLTQDEVPIWHNLVVREAVKVFLAMKHDAIQNFDIVNFSIYVLHSNNLDIITLLRMKNISIDWGPIVGLKVSILRFKLYALGSQILI